MKKILYFLLLTFCTLIPPLIAQKKSNQQAQKWIDPSLFDTKVSPKKDFYQFVNGKWLNNTRIPADRSSWGNLDELQVRVKQNVLSALTKAEKERIYKEGSDQYKAITFYNVAMDTALINKLGFQPLSPFLNEIRNINDVKSLQNYFNKASSNGIGIFYEFEIYPDMKNSNTNALYIMAGKLGLPNRDYYLKEDVEAIALREKYKEYIEKSFHMVGYSIADAKVKATTVLSTEKELAEGMLGEVEKRNPMSIYNKRSIAQLTPSVYWKEYLSSIGFDGKDSLIVFETKHMEVVGKLLSDNKLNELKNYLEWQLLNTFANFLSEEFVQVHHDFYGRILWGAQEQRPRWETVLENCNNNLGDAIGKIYVDKFFSPDAKRTATEMVDNIVDAFKGRIKNLEWMTPATKIQALEKIEALSVKIGYPDKWKSYDDLDIKCQSQGGSYLANVMSVLSWLFKEKLSKIGKPVDKSEWMIGPQTVNAYYSPVFNEIVFTAGILQPPLFNFGADEAVNYGAIGSIIGHEISHGFDDIGSQFDAKGNMKDWWTPADRKLFDEKKQQLITQFNSLEPLPGVFINGELTLGENIGDLCGVSVAFDGLKNHLQKKGQPQKIDGLGPEQRFYISYVTMWRIKQNDEALKVYITNDPHSPGKYRAIVPLQNQDSFHSAFGIKKGDGMYKAENERVSIW